MKDTSDIVKVRRVGGTYVVTLTKTVLGVFKVKIGERVWLDITPDSVTIRKEWKRK